MLVALTCGIVPRLRRLRGLVSDDGATADRPHTAPAPRSQLTADEKQVWAPLPPDRSAVPVLLYHGIGPEATSPSAADASYGSASTTSPSR